MPVIMCYVDDRTMAILQREAEASGRKVEELAEAAIESEAIRADRPAPGQPQLGFESNAGDARSPLWPEPLEGVHHNLSPGDAGLLDEFIRDELLRDDPDLGRESTLRPGYFEGDMP